MAFNLLSIFVLLTMISNVLLSNNNYDLSEDKSDWVDFGDMFSYDTKTKTNKKSGVETDSKLNDHNVCDCHQKSASTAPSEEQQISICDTILNKLDVCQNEVKTLNELTKPKACNQRITTFVSRAVLKLIKKLNSFHNQLSDENSIQITTYVFANSVQLIEQFVSQNSINCQRVDEFEDAITEVIDRLYLMNNSEQNFSSNFLENHLSKCLITISIIVLFVLIYYLYYMSIYNRILTIYGFIFTISFFWEWIHIYQEVVTKKYLDMSSAPQECLQLNHQNLTFYSAFTSYLTSYFISLPKECEKYYRAFMVDPIYEVNPLVAVSTALANAVFKPFSIMGDEFGKGLSNFYNHFNFLTKIIITIPLTIISTLMLILYMGYTIKFPYFLGSISRNADLPPVQYRNADLPPVQYRNVDLPPVQSRNAVLPPVQSRNASNNCVNSNIRGSLNRSKSKSMTSLSKL